MGNKVAFTIGIKYDLASLTDKFSASLPSLPGFISAKAQKSFLPS